MLQPSIKMFIENVASSIQTVFVDFDRGLVRFQPSPGYDWIHVEDCMNEFTKLEYLDISACFPPPASGWLASILQRNKNLKWLCIDEKMLSSVVVSASVSNMADVSNIRIECEQRPAFRHVERELSGNGECMLTKIVQSMALNGYLKFAIEEGDGMFCGDQLRLCYYFLSLSGNFGKEVCSAFA